MHATERFAQRSVASWRLRASRSRCASAGAGWACAFLSAHSPARRHGTPRDVRVGCAPLRQVTVRDMVPAPFRASSFCHTSRRHGFWSAFHPSFEGAERTRSQRRRADKVGLSQRRGKVRPRARSGQFQVISFSFLHGKNSQWNDMSNIDRFPPANNCNTRYIVTKSHMRL